MSWFHVTGRTFASARPAVFPYGWAAVATPEFLRVSSSSDSRSPWRAPLAGAVAVAVAAAALDAKCTEGEEIANWSGTHSSRPRKVHTFSAAILL